MDSMIGDIVCSSRNLLSQGFRSLPVILGGASLILGMIQANFNYLFFFVGMFILVPTCALLVNWSWEHFFAPGNYMAVIIRRVIFIAGILTFLGLSVKGMFTAASETSYDTFSSYDAFYIFGMVACILFLVAPPINVKYWTTDNASAEQCALLTINAASGVPQAINVAPTYWMTMIAFFFVYLMQNAMMLYKKQQISKAPNISVMARKSQALISMIVLVILAIIFVILRYVTSNCETMLGIFIAWMLGGSLAYAWYDFMKSCGLGRLDDLYGISNRILPLQSYEDQDPTVCVPNADEE